MKRVLVAAFAGLCAFPLLASAQTADMWSVIQQLQVDMRADRQAVVAANLPLTEAEAKAFWPVYKEYRNGADKLGDRVANLIVQYANNYESLTETTADSMTKEWFKIDGDRVSLREKYYKSLKKVLPAAKAVRALQIENKLDNIVNLGMAAEVPLVPTTKQ